jgi:3-oxo-5alpha-steroid 4-dehydrogenase
MIVKEFLNKAVSRRGFLGSAGAGAAGLAAAGLGFQQADAAPLEPPANWDYEADVVVIGYGGAGTCAAIEAAEAGASVLAIEKTTTAGGNTSHSGGIVYLGGGTPLQKMHGFDDTPENMYNYLVAQMGPTADKNRIQIYSEQSVGHYDWLTQRGVVFGQKFWEGKVVQPPSEEGGLSFSGNEANSPYSEIAIPMPRGHMPAGAGAQVYAPLKATADKLPIQTIYNTQGERLVVDKSGAVVGIQVRSGIPDPGVPNATPVALSGEIFVKANKGVILTTGGFQFNPEMLAQYAPWYLSAFPLGGPSQVDDGSGIKMGQSVGAALYDLSFASPWKFVYAPGEMCKCILVDQVGARFVGESRYGQDVGDLIIRRNGGVAWQIFDTPTYEAAKAAGGFFSEPVGTADTVEELAASINVDPAILANTVSFYNEQAKQGKDPLFLKHEEFLTPLETGPFLAFDFGVSTGIAFITLGGLRCTENAEVINSFGEIIPGLYSAGKTAPGINPEYYVSGSAVGDGTFWGRAAGRAAAAAASR